MGKVRNKSSGLEKQLALKSKVSKNIIHHKTSPSKEGKLRKIPIGYVSTLNPEANKHLKNYLPPNDRPVRIYCDGIYDMLHYGHARSLEQVKKLFPNVHLLVGLCNDELTMSKKGRTVMDEHERAESLRHCKWVDEIVENAPWTIDEAFLEKHSVDFVAHDDIPYQSEDSDDVYKFVKDKGQFIATQRTSGISTSDLITRIVRDYDSYVRRNLQRGATPSELNLSILKQGEIKMEQLKGKLKKKIQEEEKAVVSNWENTRDELVVMLNKWEEKSQELIKDFSSRFDIQKILKKISPKKNPNSNANNLQATTTMRNSFKKKLLDVITGRK